MKKITCILMALLISVSAPLYASTEQSPTKDQTESQNNALVIGIDFNKTYSMQELKTIKDDIINQGLFSEIYFKTARTMNEQQLMVLSVNAIVSDSWMKDYTVSNKVGLPQFHLLSKMFSIKYGNGEDKQQNIYNGQLYSFFDTNKGVVIRVINYLDTAYTDRKNFISVDYTHAKNIKKAEDYQKITEDKNSSIMAEKYLF